MSSPHIAGIAALLQVKQPDLVADGDQVGADDHRHHAGQHRRSRSSGRGDDATPLDYGAGHVGRPARSTRAWCTTPTPLDWLQYTCGIGQHQLLGDGRTCATASGQIDPSDLNYPTIAVGDLAGKQTVTRTVTNATNQASVYVPKVQAPAGFTVKVTPAVLTVLPRRSATYKVEITRTTAAAAPGRSAR